MKTFEQIIAETQQLNESTLINKSSNLRKSIESFLRDVSQEQKAAKTQNEKRVYTDIGVLVSHLLAKVQEIDNKIHMDL
jgi:hypothetical protein